MFKDDQVLQENVVIKLERDARQGNVIISSSSDDSLGDYAERSVPFSEIVHVEDYQYEYSCDNNGSLDEFRQASIEQIDRMIADKFPSLVS